VIGRITNDVSGQYQFTDPGAATDAQRFYQVTFP
jgi:hypothetical protein